MNHTGAGMRSDGMDAWAGEMNAVLRDSVLAFWLERCVDAENGGYFMHFDAEGRRQKRSRRGIVAQSRNLYLFSRAARNDFGGQGLPQAEVLLDAARHGFVFLRDHMWDRQHGGFIWFADERKREPRRGKLLYGQAFALFALSEYYRSSRDEEARTLATALFDVVDQRAYDRVHGGYDEQFDEDWMPASNSTPGIGETPGLKSLNCHMHMMEGLTCYVEATGSPQASDRLAELITLFSGQLLDTEHGVHVDLYTPEWVPAAPAGKRSASHGHNIELVHLLAEACQAMGQDTSSVRVVGQRAWSYSLEFGLDEKDGSVLEGGALGQVATDRGKVWWVQAESLLSALLMYRTTGDPQYESIARRLWELIDTRFVDREFGEWRSTITDGGTIPPDKGSNWKAGYHTGRCLMESMKLLSGV